MQQEFDALTKIMEDKKKAEAKIKSLQGSIKSTKKEEDLNKLFDSLATKKLELLEFDTLI